MIGGKREKEGRGWESCFAGEMREETRAMVAAGVD